ncbi:glucooligosaccharide oxidase [Moniliophthora roreri MCA 2997]|uniref:Glucooligosaccharide oxidase n=2 Tax=Moniliophthora roreri TaxID=221103 RepID=V2XAI5_MONRO|nr:glucooligosaccharide oxidase [Moniliophthora roreri MCA 2997]KAI3606321.1 glucooligosaccharide oxidase [Moniliophthora roreri]KAI3619519.1 glucooligosaccharide oxidase [Moniliophthora roreri]
MFLPLLIPFLPLAFAQYTSLREQLASDGIRAVFADDVEYGNVTRAYNMRYTPSPIAVTFPTNTSQVSLIVKAGAKEGIRVVAKSGGHSYIANSIGSDSDPPALVVDLGAFKDITYDGETQTAVIEPGNRLGEVALALNEYGRAIPHGRCSWVGFGGHSGFGGWGFSSRMWGLTLDNVLSATVVLANGTVVTASEGENTELFWAIRGSSSSFGIVTSLTMRTHPVPPSGTFFEYIFDLDIATASKAFSDFQKYALSPSLPNTFGGELGVLKGRERGRVSVVFLGSFYGDTERYVQVVTPFLDTLPPWRNDSIVVNGTWIDVVTAGAAGNLTVEGEMPRDTFYAKSLMTPQDVLLTEEAMHEMMRYLGEEGFDSDTFWHVEIEIYGGVQSVINSVPLNATAFGHRDTLFTFQPYASTGDLLPPWDDAIFGFVEGMVSSITDNMPQDWKYGAYANYIDPRLPDWQHRYYGTNYERLQKLKGEVDGDDVFRFITSIEVPEEEAY